MHHARATDLCKLPLETCQIHYDTSVGCELVTVIYLFTWFLLVSLQSLVWKVRVANCLKNVSLQTKTIFETKNDSCSKLGIQLCACLSLEVVNYLELEKFRHLEVWCLWNSHFNTVHASVYEIAFEFTLRNVYIFKLPLMDDRNIIWFTWLFFPTCFFFNSTTPLEINTVWEERNIKILSVIDYSPSFQDLEPVFSREMFCF